MGFAIVGWLGLSIVAGVGPVEDLDDALRLRWNAPPQCPALTQVRKRVALSIPPRQVPSRRVDAQGSVERTPQARWRLRLVIDTGEGTIEPDAEADDCETLVDAAVLQLVIALQPALPVARVPPESKPQPKPEPEPEPEPALHSEPEPDVRAEPTRRRIEGLVGGGGGVGFGVVPRYDGWLTLTGGVRVPMRTRLRSLARAEVFVGHAFAQTQRRSPDDDAGVRVAAWWVAPRGCWEPAVAGEPRLATFTFPLCGGFDFAAVTGRGIGVEQSARRARLWIAVAAGASAQWQPLPRLGFRLGVESFVTVQRPAFTVDRGAPIYTVGWGGLRGLLLAQVVLP